jgi:hypothetical protein
VKWFTAPRWYADAQHPTISVGLGIAKALKMQQTVSDVIARLTESRCPAQSSRHAARGGACVAICVPTVAATQVWPETETTRLLLPRSGQAISPDVDLQASCIRGPH